jgi:hypothetical protein
MNDDAALAPFADGVGDPRTGCANGRSPVKFNRDTGRLLAKCLLRR